MPADPDLAKSMLLSSDYPMDKVVFRASGSVSVATGTSEADTEIVTIAHGLGYVPLMSGTYSKSSTFATYFEFGTSPYAYDSFFMQYLPEYDAVVTSDSTNVYVRFLNWTTTATFYYRVIGFEPPNVTSTPIITTAGNSFRLNTDYNYMKLFMSGVDSHNFSGGPDTRTIYHGLGYRPTTSVWSKEGGVMRQSGSEYLTDATPGVATVSTVDSNNLYVDVDSTSSSVELYYRIYLDD